MSYTILSADEQKGFDSRHPEYASTTWNSDISGQGTTGYKYITDSVLGTVLIYYHLDDSNVVVKQFIKTDLSSDVVTETDSESGWLSTFLSSFVDEVGTNTSNLVSSVTNYTSSNYLIPIAVIAVVLFIFVYLPKRR
jgi:hypothetical protein